MKTIFIFAAVFLLSLPVIRIEALELRRDKSAGCDAGPSASTRIQRPLGVRVRHDMLQRQEYLNRKAKLYHPREPESNERRQAEVKPGANQWDELATTASYTTEVYLLDTVVVYTSTKDTTRSCRTYDEAGNMLTNTWEQWYRGEWTKLSRESYTYDASGNYLIDLVEFWQRDQWVSAYRYTYSYDANGNELVEVSEESQNGQWANIDRHTSTYDADRNRLTYLTENWQTGQWVNWSRYSYSYDSQGNMLSRLFESWDGSQWTLLNRDTFTYDENGNELIGLYEWSQDEVITNRERDTYTYDEDGRESTYLLEVWEAGGWVSSRRTTNTWDASGTVDTMFSQEWQEGQWVDSYRFASSYDVNGAFLTSSVAFWQNDHWAVTEDIAMTYNAAGEYLTWTCWEWENGTLTSAQRDTNTYDANGNLILYMHQVLQGSTWVTSDGDGTMNYAPYGFQGDSLTYIWEKKEIVDVASGKPLVPVTASLSQNYPNPFNPTTTIKFGLPKQSQVSLVVYDILGREVKELLNDKLQAGYYHFTWDATRFASGVYFYRIEAQSLSGDKKSFVEVKKLLLLK